MGLIGMLPNVAAVARLVWALPTLKPIHYRDDGLWARPIIRQPNACMIVREWELSNILIDLLSQRYKGLVLDV